MVDALGINIREGWHMALEMPLFAANEIIPEGHTGSNPVYPTTLPVSVSFK